MLHRNLILAGALAAFGASASAQSHPGKIFARHNKPLRSASLDLATSTVTRGPAVGDRGAATVAEFDNLDLGGFVGVDTGGGFCEWIDAGTKGQVGNASDLVTNLVFAYCSVVLDPDSGGPGGSVLLGFYEGYETGGPAPTTAVALINLTGLPGHTADSSVVALLLGSGNDSCYFLNLDLANCFSFADGDIGYSWGFTDLGTTGVLAGTFPFLSCVQSCSGTGPDGQGMVDLMDEYCPPGGAANTFSFGTTPSGSYFTSISMLLVEAADAEAVAVTFVGAGVNLDIYTSSAIAIGAGWENAIFVEAEHGPAGPTSIRVRPACALGPIFFSPTADLVQVLTMGPLLLVIADAHVGGFAGYEPDFPVPCDVSLVGLPWAAQGTVAGGGSIDLTNARCGVVGSVDFIPDP